jgi:hypothetical protein
MSAPVLSADMRQLQVLDEACSVVREFRGSQASLASIELLDALEKVYLQELRGVKPDGLIALQAYLAQIDKLRATLRGEAGGARI